MSDKIFPDANTALAGITRDTMTVMAGGFGLCGIPEHLIEALKIAGPKNLTVIGNNVGCDGHGMWKVLANGQIRKVIASYVGENKLLESSYMKGEIEIESTHRARWPNAYALAVPASPPSSRRPALGPPSRRARSAGSSRASGS